jgi:hypothetical protein
MSELRERPDGVDIHLIEASAWHHITVADVVAMATEIYGSDAVTAAAWCAIEARSDCRESDYRFWLRVFKHLRQQSVFSSQIDT